MKKALLSFGPLSVACMRTAGGAALIWLILMIQRKKILFSKKLTFQLLLIASTSSIIPFMIQPYLIQDYGSGFIGMMVGMVPICTIVWSKLLYDVKVTKVEFLGVCIGLMCLVGIFSDGLNRSLTLSHFFLALCVPLGYAFTNTYIRHRLSHVGAIELTFSKLSIATVVLLPISVSTEQVDVNIYFNLAIFSAILLGCFGTGLAGYLFYKMIKMKGALFAGLVTYIIPIYAIFFGWLDGEKVTHMQLISILGIIVSVFLIQLHDFFINKNHNVHN